MIHLRTDQILLIRQAKLAQRIGDNNMVYSTELGFRGHRYYCSVVGICKIVSMWKILRDICCIYINLGDITAPWGTLAWTFFVVELKILTWKVRLLTKLVIILVKYALMLTLITMVFCRSWEPLLMPLLKARNIALQVFLYIRALWMSSESHRSWCYVPWCSLN